MSNARDPFVPETIRHYDSEHW